MPARRWSSRAARFALIELGLGSCRRDRLSVWAGARCAPASRRRLWVTIGLVVALQLAVWRFGLSNLDSLS